MNFTCLLFRLSTIYNWYKNLDEKEMLFQLKQIVYELELQNSVTKESKSIAGLISENISLLQPDTNQRNTIKTGFTDFDNRYGGFRLGEFVVVGGRPSMGKTQLLIHLALHISKSVPVLYFSFDLSEHLLTNRFISSFSGIAVDKILQQELTDEQKINLPAITEELGERKIFVNDSCNSSLSAMKAICQKHIQENGVKLIIVDYLQMMSSARHRNNRDTEISYITRELKNIARDFDVCVIASSQLSRSVETRGGAKYPQLSDLRESGAIEQDADKVIFIYRPEYYNIDCDMDGNSTAGLTELILAKNRNGKVGVVRLLHDENFTGFRSFDGFKEDFTFSKNRLEEIDNSF